MLVRKTRQHSRTLLPRPTFVIPSLKPTLCLVLLCGAVAALAPLSALGAVSGNKTTVPCWKRLMNDWDDGTINNVYPPACYLAAIKNMPTELKIYSSAREDIERALQARLAGKPIPPESSPPQSTTTTGGGGTTTTPSKPHKTGIRLFLAKLTPGDPQAFPLPLLILGALAILLVAAGVVGMLWQRSHPRDEPPPA